MRYLLVGFSVFAAACSGATPTGPTSASAVNGGAVALTAAMAGSELPFKGNLHATEAVEGNLHSLSGTGNGTQVGQFGYAAAITVDEETGQGLGTVVWTAANGDQIFASTTGEVLGLEFPNLVLAESANHHGWYRPICWRYRYRRRQSLAESSDRRHQRHVYRHDRPRPLIAASRIEKAKAMRQKFGASAAGRTPPSPAQESGRRRRRFARE